MCNVCFQLTIKIPNSIRKSKNYKKLFQTRDSAIVWLWYIRGWAPPTDTIIALGPRPGCAACSHLITLVDKWKTITNRGYTFNHSMNSLMNFHRARWVSNESLMHLTIDAAPPLFCFIRFFFPNVPFAAITQLTRDNMRAF